MQMLSTSEEDNYTVFLSTLTKKQLILLAIQERNYLINSYSRFQRLRLSVSYGDEGSPFRVIQDIERDDEAHKIGTYPEDLDYDRFIQRLRDDGMSL